MGGTGLVGFTIGVVPGVVGLTTGMFPDMVSLCTSVAEGNRNASWFS